MPVTQNVNVKTNVKKATIIVVSNLYPNCLEPTRGIFTQQIVQQLRAYYEVIVVAPVAYRPQWYYRYTKKARVPDQETLDGVSVYHPRYFVLPKLGRFTYGYCFYLGIIKQLKALCQQHPVTLINVHWAYPDGFGALLAAKQLNKPLVLHTLGCDINEYTRYWARRQMIAHTLRNTQANIHVSQPLQQVAQALGSALQKKSCGI